MALWHETRLSVGVSPQGFFIYFINPIQYEKRIDCGRTAA